MNPGARRTVEVLRGARSLLTPHPADAYPGLLVWCGPGWELGVIVADDGQTVLARGGERAYGYETGDGGRAAAFELGPGDSATLARSGLPHALVEWRIERV